MQLTLSLCFLLCVVGRIRHDHLAYLMHNYYTQHTVHKAVASWVNPIHAAFMQIQSYVNAHEAFVKKFPAIKGDPIGLNAYRYAVEYARKRRFQPLMDTRKAGPLIAASLIEVYEKNKHLSGAMVHKGQASKIIMTMLLPLTIMLDSTCVCVYVCVVWCGVVWYADNARCMCSVPANYQGVAYPDAGVSRRCFPVQGY